MKLLIAEDEPIYRQLLQIILAEAGYETVVARNGLEAWEILTSAAPPPIALLDWSMPEMDGIEVCRKVRQEHQGQRIYIILLTGRTSPEDAAVAAEAGADEWLSKPADLREIPPRIEAARQIMESRDEG